MTILDRILERKREEIRELRARGGEAELERAARAAPPPRGFARALREAERPRVIAEFKRASPSKGVLRAGADPAEIARLYAEAGAAALSVLTDREFFQGALEDLAAARAVTGLPILRKDFVLDPIQVLEARTAGADAVLLIVAALDDAPLVELIAAAGEAGLDALVEVHDGAELDRALAAGADPIGINNRDLRTFETRVEVTRELLPRAGGRTVVSESGLDDAATLAKLDAEGVHAFLVGEALMGAADPGEALRALRGRP
jgi:indole-3-glycerol phosphate synthase